MRVAIFSTKPYDRHFLEVENREFGHRLTFLEAHLAASTIDLAADHEGVCLFVNDRVDGDVMRRLARLNVRYITLRATGFNNVDLDAARRHGIAVARVRSYSPNAVAEHTVGLILSLNRKIHRAYARVRDGNFSLDGLLGFDLYGRTVGIVGTGAIGTVVARILTGFGCRILATDPAPNPDCLALGVTYVSLPALTAESDILTLHCPLNPSTLHLIDAKAIAAMKPGVMLINTSRGAVIDAKAALAGLKTRKIGYLGLDVYEEEADVFFEDLSDKIISDDILMRFLTLPNVLITSHQGFFTEEAMVRIARTTLTNLKYFEAGQHLENDNILVPRPEPKEELR